MEILKELVSIVNRIRLRSIRNMGFPFRSDNQTGKMYELLADGVDESTIAQAVTGSTGKNSSFRRIQAELEHRLIASLFLVDVSRPLQSDRHRAYYELHKQWTAAKILQGEKAIPAALKLAERSLRQARNYEFNDLRFAICRDLRLLYGTSRPRRDKYLKYVEECEEAERLLRAEYEAEALYAEIVSSYVRQNASPLVISEKAKEAVAKLAPYQHFEASYTLHLYLGLLRMMVYTTVDDYDATLKVCDTMINQFTKKPYQATVPLHAATYQKLVCYFQLQKFGADLDNFSDRLDFLEEGEFNWFKYQEILFLLAMHQGNYARAFHIYNNVRKQPRLTQLSAEIEEYWRVLEAYLHLLVKLNMLPEAQGDKRFTKFRIGRFLNQTPIFSQDKRGVNVSILIIQITFLLVRQRYNDALNKIDAVEQYCRRHLFREDTLRSYYFIKALLELPKNQLHREGVKRKAERYLVKMRTYPLEQASMAGVITEILPFDHLWNWVMDQLPTRHYRSRKQLKYILLVW